MFLVQGRKSLPCSSDSIRVTVFPATLRVHM